MTNQVLIDGDRLWQSIQEMAQIGATEKGGVKRLAFSAEDRISRDRFIDDCIELNMTIRRDAIGNIFALMQGTNSELPVVMVGSHLDSQPTGGKYDGALGVLAALEIARSVYAAGQRPVRGLEIVNFANEEGARFAPPMMGSGVFAGKLALDAMLDTTDFTGVSVAEAMGEDKTGALEMRGNRPIAYFFETHIEQGPHLEEEGLPIGIVVGAVAQRWYDVNITGFESHAGPTPMAYRKDALAAAAEVVLAVERIAQAQAPSGRGTVGTLALQPFSRNVIPGSVQLTVDTRHPSEDALLAMKAALQGACDEIGARRGVEVVLSEFWHSAVRPFDAGLIERLEAFSAERNLPTRRIWSHAGHDAVYIASTGVPTVMLFIQTKDGISHNEAESIKREHAIAGVQVLCDAVVEKLFEASR
ncbi:MAG: Zn-dependent hydrolase [Candidatus Promineifilaceae bacterium]